MVGIKDELLADQDAREKSRERAKCRTCKALRELTPEARTEYEDIMTDKSFQDISISRWLTANTSETVGASSVDTHRKNHLS